MKIDDGSISSPLIASWSNIIQNVEMFTRRKCWSKYMRHGHFEGVNLRSELWLLGITDWQSDRSVLLRTSSLIRAWRKKKRENKYVESSSSTCLHILLSAFRMVQRFRPRSSCCLDCLPHGYLRRAAGLNITMRLLEQSRQACHWILPFFVSSVEHISQMH